MIEKTIGYKVRDQFFPTIEEAQRHELAQLFLSDIYTGQQVQPDKETVELFASKILADADKIVDILTMRPSSKPKARKINGAKRKKTETVEAA